MSQLGRQLRRPLSAARNQWVIRTDPSYRSSPGDYGLPEGIDRVYCHHIAKTGGTSLHRSFMALGGEDPGDVHRRIAASPHRRTMSGRYVFVAHRRSELEDGRYFYGWSHAPSHQMALPPRTFSVTVLRDPARRVESFFRYLLAGDEPGTPFPVKETKRAWAAGGLAGFLDVVPRRSLLRQLYTFSARFDVAEAAERIAACSYVFFTEAYEEGVAGLADRLDVPLEARRERVTTGEFTFTDAERARLREAVEPEYDLLRRVGCIP